MAQSLKCRGTEFSLHYAGRSLSEMAFSNRLARAFPQEITLYEGQGQRLNVKHVMESADNQTVFYVCGPSSLIQAVIEAGVQLSIATDRIKYERFSAFIKDSAHGFTVELSQSAIKLHVDKKDSLLDTLIKAGVEQPYSCKTGDCKACTVKVLKGDVEHHDNCLTEEEKQDQNLMCPCVSRAKSSHLVLDL